MLAAIGTGSVVLAQRSSEALGQEAAPVGGGGVPDPAPRRFANVEAMQSQTTLREGEWAETVGYRAPGDGGAAWYRVQKASEEAPPNGGDVLALQAGLVAVLQERNAIAYRMFGALGDGQSDDGAQIRLAHEYANRQGLPVVNLSGEFWLQRSRAIPILTPVQWGRTVFHIDERHNSRRFPCFIVRNDHPSKELSQDLGLKDALLERLRPGVQIIPELAPYAGHLFSVQDANDRIGIRAGYAGNRGWAREELFYVEEEGRIVGDIAWQFQGITTLTATPCNDNYLVIQGGCFYFSGDTPEGSAPGYHQHGILVQRSRTILREQWMGLEPGRRDVSLEPRSGFYVLNGVYDVTLENIRAMPWEKGRREPGKAVQHGTYGIGGARMLSCTFRNLTAEGGWVAWGVFGTNLNKNFRLEHCRLNRVDVHFHCWNLHISRCTIGFKGISVTGGGELLIENSTRHGNEFVHFRPDYGAKWDGPIRLRGCTLKPSGNGRVAVLSLRPSDFDYQYPIGLGTDIAIEDLRIDYSAAPASTDPCWLMDIAPFSRNRQEQRLFFPQRLTFRDVVVAGREQGVRLLRIPNPYHYDLRRPGGCDDSRMQANCLLVCERVQLERMSPASPGDRDRVHLLLGGENPAAYADGLALYPKIVFVDCDHVSLYLGQCVAGVFLQRCSVNSVTALALRGELSFDQCRLQPEVTAAGEVFYALDSSLGTRLTGCTLHAPVVNGESVPGLVDRLGLLEVNGAVRHCHLNTVLGNEVMGYLKGQGVALTPAFVARLTAHHPASL
jgi:hypothetical protein